LTNPDNHSERLNQLPKGWVWTKLGNVCETTSGGTPSRKNKNYFGGNIPWLKSGELENGIIKSAEESITKEGLENSSAKIIPKGTLLIALYGATVGKLGILGIGAAINQAICAIFTPDCLNQKFLFWYLSSYRNELLNARIGGAQPNISQQIVNDIPHPFPPPPEQRRIVSKIEELFTRLDAGVEAMKKIKAQLKQYRQAVLKYAFEGKLTGEWREAHKNELKPASVLLERIKEERKNKNDGKVKELPPLDTSDLPELPEGWHWAKVGICSTLITKGESPAWQGFSYTQEGIPFIRSENILWGYINFSNITHIPQEFHQKLKRSKIKPNDVLINIVGASIGRCAVIPPTITEANINQAVALIRTNEAILPYYLMHILISPQIQENVRSARVETARPNISLTDLNNLIIPIPPITEQHQIIEEIERHLSIADNIEKAVDHSMQQSEKLRQSILKRAFEGRLVPQDPDDEPAERLLERIMSEKAIREAERKPRKRGGFKAGKVQGE